jgi:pimeloyl-ACP methyl ester carboxylesterase
MDARTTFDRLEARLYEEHGLDRRVVSVQVRVPQALRIRVVETGPASGIPVVFVHGGGGFGATLVPLLAQLEGIRAIVPDRPGCGLSEGVGLERIDLRRHAVDFLGGVYAALGVASATVLGTSMGGLWACWLALDRPELVERLALIGCPALTLGTSGPLPLRLMGKTILGRRMLARGTNPREGALRVLGRLGESREVVQRSGGAFVDLMVASVEVPGWTDNWIGLLGNALTLRGANPRWALGEEEVRTIGKPVLLAWGTRDPLGSVAIGQRLAELTEGRLVELEGAGHMPWLDEPAGLAAALHEFIPHSDRFPPVTSGGGLDAIRPPLRTSGTRPVS